MSRLTTNERHRAVGFLEAGVGNRQVARMTGCSPSTIINLRRRYQETNFVDNRSRPDAERVTTPDQDRYIVLQHLRNRFRTAVQTAAENQGTTRNEPVPPPFEGDSMLIIYEHIDHPSAMSEHHFFAKIATSGRDVIYSLMSRDFASIITTVVKECGADLVNITPSVAYVSMTGGMESVSWCGQVSQPTSGHH